MSVSSEKIVYIFGSMGTGKSTLLNYLIGAQVTIATLSPTAVTKDVTEHVDVKHMVRGSVEATQSDIDMFNRTGAIYLERHQYKFVEFPGFNESKFEDELRNNIDLLKHIADGVVHGFIYCLRCNDRISRDVSSHLSYLKELFGAQFESSCLLVLTRFDRKEFRDTVCVANAASLERFDLKIDDNKLERFKADWVKTVCEESSVKFDADRLFMVDADMDKEDAELYYGYLANRENPGGDLLWRQNWIYFSLEARRSIIQYFDTTSTNVVVSGSNCLFSPNINVAISHVVIGILEELTKQTSEQFTALFNQKLQKEAEKRALCQQIQVKAENLEFRSSGAHERQLSCGVREEISVYAMRNVEKVTLVRSGPEKYVLRLTAPAVPAAIMLKWTMNGRELNQSHVVLLESELKIIEQKLAPIAPKMARSRQILEAQLQQLKNPKFDNFEDIASLLRSRFSLSSSTTPNSSTTASSTSDSRPSVSASASSSSGALPPASTSTSARSLPPAPNRDLNRKK